MLIAIAFFVGVITLVDLVASSTRNTLATILLAMLMVLCRVLPIRADEQPRSLDTRLKIELFAENPQIVTPTGLDVDHRGRVFAIESNTHFPPDGYQGHPTDRVLVISDSNGSGKADTISVFTDGLKHSMSVAVRPIWFPVGATKESPAPKQSVYIATRREIFLFHDDDGDDKADRKDSIVRLDTKGDYPHNGIAGFAIDALGWLYFGFGENLGSDYRMIGSDGTTFSGGGEGGNIYRCRLDGTKLSRVATGFWNPHASCIDAFGRLFTVDNDPDSRPPCRLIHVIPEGDYGYRFRNGRKGLHPFTAWNGEIPGTLPMVAGTGEAPSGIVAYESDGLPGDDHGNLLVTSWGDHRIDRFRLQPKGTSFASFIEPVITGGDNFRPVGLAVAPDGSLFCTDWVKKDYTLHGTGRIWRISSTTPRLTPVIALTEIASKDSNELLKLLDSPRREVRRIAARSLFSKTVANDATKDPRSRDWKDLKSSPRGLVEAVWAGLATQVDESSTSFVNSWQSWELSTPTIATNQRRETARSASHVGDFNDNRIREVASGLVAGLKVSQLDDDLVLALIPRAKLKAGDVLVKLLLTPDDPFLFSAAVTRIAEQFKQDDFAKFLIRDATPDVKSSSPRVRQAMLLAARKQAPKEDRLVRIALDDHDADVRRLAVQWVAEENLIALRPRVEAVFNSGGMTTELFLATLAALEMLDGKSPKDFDQTPAEKYVLPILKDDTRTPAVRAQALRLVAPTDPSLDQAFFQSLLKSDQAALRLEAVRTLQAALPEVSLSLLIGIAADEEVDTKLRAEAVVGLANVAKSEVASGPTRQFLKSLMSHQTFGPLTVETLRAVRSLIAEDADLRDAVLKVEQTIDKAGSPNTRTELADQLAILYGELKRELPESIKRLVSVKPKDRMDWLGQLNRGRDVDPAAGRRIFFHPNGPGCFKCHVIDGRGGKIGPDLSRSVGNMNRIQLIQSILEPSREISPQYTSWTFELQNGKSVTGMIVHENTGKTVVGDSTGKLIELDTAEIATRVPQKISVMPEKLADRMTLQELRDLIAYLDSQR